MIYRHFVKVNGSIAAPLHWPTSQAVPARSKPWTGLGDVSFDPNLREEVWANQAELKPAVLQAIALADVVKFSDDELMLLTETNSLEDGIVANAELGNPLVLITQGAKGAIVLFDGGREVICGEALKPIDTTGACLRITS